MSPTHHADHGISARTLEHLEWARLVTSALARCKSPSARRRGLPFASNAQDMHRVLGETREAMQLLAQADGLPLHDLRDVEAHVLRLEREGTLDAPALADLRVTLETARALRRFLGARRGLVPALAQSATFDPSLDALEALIAAAVELDGTLKDDASDDLRRIRQELAALRERIVGRLQDVIERDRDLLSDSYYTLRDGRYVLPVRRDAHDRLPGIVHGTSESGASIFVEPRAVVAHGNRLKMAESEREREELRILTALSNAVRQELASVREAVVAIDRLDLRHASARLGLDMQGIVPELEDGPHAHLKGARHPLLVLEGAHVVPNDIEIEGGRGLVISGPNAGGKTVVLKTLGLCVLMLRCGLPVPVAEGSKLGFFSAVLCDMGDEQSTATNLSTFSAHIRNLASLLSRTDDRALVLLDEVATGTDPGEGAALACALVDAFCARGAALIVTTHYESLKAMSLRDPRLRSASVGLDTARMEPTFQLLLDVPGASSALTVARRFGLPGEIVDAAERLLPQQSRDFELLVANLSTAASTLRDTRDLLAQERAALATERREYQERLSRLREQSKHKLSKEAEKLMLELRQARSELDTVRSALRSDERKSQELAAAQKKLGEVAARVAPGSEIATAVAAPPAQPEARLDAKALVVGARVYVPRLRSQAVIAEMGAKGKVLVAVGAMKLWVEGAELRASATAQPEPAPLTRVHTEVNTSLGRLPDNTVDVRGLRADDALALVDSFIDRLYGGTGRVGYVLHGHGTGALRIAVREHLKNAPAYVEKTRPGEQEEGGDAVTVFFLA